MFEWVKMKIDLDWVSGSQEDLIYKTFSLHAHTFLHGKAESWSKYWGKRVNSVTMKDVYDEFDEKMATKI